MNRHLLYVLLLSLISLNACSGNAQELVLTDNGGSDYVIVTPASPTKIEAKAAQLLQHFIKEVSGTEIPVIDEKAKRGKSSVIFVGNTGKAEKTLVRKKQPESYFVYADGKDLVFCAGSGHRIIYGIYFFAEKYLHCKKLSNDPPIIPTARRISIPGSVNEEHVPPFIYREAYYPAAHNPEYLEWRQLQQLDDLWGLWGHSFNKLVPAQTFFKTNPEYFSLVKGKRQPSQLCLSNEAVYKLVVADLKQRMAKNPDAIYWSISPNDDNGYCECDACRATDREQGSPSGSLIKFVNRVANAFPDKLFTTLAYGYTQKAPRSLKPASNVFVFLSDIDAFRDKPLSEEGSAAAFRNGLKAWGELTGNIFIWDYVTQFTNYLAPFPNCSTLQPNIQYLKQHGVKGIFSQGSGDTYSEWAELKSYLLAKLYEDDKADVKKLTSEFFRDYYGKAAPYLQQYFDLLQEKMVASKRKLDIYGNPVNEWKSYLTPELLEQYSNLFDKAEGAVEGNPVMATRVMRARLPLEYTVFQQAKFYGIEKHGIFIKGNAGKWSVKPNLQEKVTQFVANCKKAGVTELSEAGPARTPDEYLAEWNSIFKKGVTPSLALDAKVSLQNPFAEDYPAKGNRTLIDGNPGYLDYSYNWLCFYGVPMIATIDLGKATKISGVRMHFLDDPRHWIFLPENINVELSADGTSYHSVAEFKSAFVSEHYDAAVKEFASKTISQTARYIRVTATNLKSLPEWRYRDGKKPMIACDEIFVQ